MTDSTAQPWVSLEGGADTRLARTLIRLRNTCRATRIENVFNKVIKIEGRWYGNAWGAPLDWSGENDGDWLWRHRLAIFSNRFYFFPRARMLSFHASVSWVMRKLSVSSTLSVREIPLFRGYRSLVIIRYTTDHFFFFKRRSGPYSGRTSVVNVRYNWNNTHPPHPHHSHTHKTKVPQTYTHAHTNERVWETAFCDGKRRYA